MFAGIQLEWKAPDVDGLVEFLCRDKGFKSVLCMDMFCRYG